MVDFDDAIFVMRMQEKGRFLNTPFQGIAKYLLARASFRQADKGEIHRVIHVGHDASLYEKDLYGAIKAFYAWDWHDFQSAKEKAEWAEDIRKNG